MKRRAFTSAAAFALAVNGIGLFSQPASAQFGTIFGNPPPRPPADIPGRAPDDRYPQRYPQSAPQALPPSSNLPPNMDRGGNVQSQPLPPPGAPAAPLDAAPPQQGSLTPAPPAEQRPPRGAPQPADTTPQPGDEVIAEPPAQKIPNNTAVFSGLDKITGRIISFDVAINETVQFGALQVTPRACYTRPATDTQNTDGFVEVSEVTLQGEVRRIFNGWMFASSPGLHGVEHSIYDVWLTECKEPQSAVADEAPAPAPQKPPARPAGAAAQPRTGGTPASPQQQRPAQQPTPRAQAPAAPAGTLANPR